MPQKPDTPNYHHSNSLKPRGRMLLNVGELIAAVGLFVFSLFLMRAAFLLFEGSAEELLGLADNPFIGFFLGLLATSLVQSSSTTTASLVALVAMGKLSLIGAIPMVMGANIGTAITSTIVSLGHISNVREYPKAIAAAALHDFFNIITALLLFGLEYLFQLLSSSSVALAEMVPTRSGIVPEGVFFFLRNAADSLVELTATASFPLGNPYFCLPLGLLGLYLAIRFLTQILKNILIGNVEKKLNRYFFRNPWQSLFWGFLTTAFVQSSSVTTSLIVPLVATGKVWLSQAFPFIMGANIGTTTTALLAAIFIGSENIISPQAALAIAFAHFLFNLFGTLILMPSARIRNMPVKAAERLGLLALRNRVYGVLYIVIMFFILPGLLIWLFK
jgi:sodium-dependent phosphate cotransporter